MPNPQSVPWLRPFLLAGGGLVVAALVLTGVMFVDARRTSFSDADRTGSEAAVARMDAAQARANDARAQAQKRTYKGY